MRRLPPAQLAAAISRMETASATHLDGDRGAFGRWLEAEGNRPARLEFPCGELLNPAIAGFVWAWYLQGRIQLDGIAKADGFAAQGLEGKAIVEVQLVAALLTARDLPVHRCNVHTTPRAADR
jgi:hypothetical protein